MVVYHNNFEKSPKHYNNTQLDKGIHPIGDQANVNQTL